MSKGWIRLPIRKVRWLSTCPNCQGRWSVGNDMQNRGMPPCVSTEGVPEFDIWLQEVRPYWSQVPRGDGKLGGGRPLAGKLGGSERQQATASDGGRAEQRGYMYGATFRAACHCPEEASRGRFAHDKTMKFFACHPPPIIQGSDWVGLGGKVFFTAWGTNESGVLAAKMQRANKGRRWAAADGMLWGDILTLRCLCCPWP
jgi:hypothetical protein